MRLRSLVLVPLLLVGCASEPSPIPPSPPPAPPIVVTPAPESVRGVSAFVRGDGELEPFVRVVERNLMKAGFIVVDTPARDHELTITLVGDGHSESRSERGRASVSMAFRVDATVAAGGAMLDEISESGRTAVVQDGDFNVFNAQVADARRSVHENMAASLVNRIAHSEKVV